jgi:hypothetical protein
MQTMSAPPPEDRLLQVFSLKELIDDTEGPDTVLSAVELALQMGEPSKEPAEVKFHADSGLLIINASRDEVSSVDELLHRMRDDVMRERGMAESAARRRLDDELSVNIAEAKLQTCEARLAFAADALERIKALHQTGQVPIEEVHAAELEQLNARSELDIVRAEHEAARARMAHNTAPRSPPTPGLEAEVKSLREQVTTLQAKIKELEAKKK